MMKITACVVVRLGRSVGLMDGTEHELCACRTKHDTATSMA